MSDGFDNRIISDGPVTQLQWMAGMNFISASTFSSVSFVTVVLILVNIFNFIIYPGDTNPNC